MQGSGTACREDADLRLHRCLTIESDAATRHCERSEAIHVAACRDMDCFVALLLAMTKRNHSGSLLTFRTQARTSASTSGSTAFTSSTVMPGLMRGS